MPSGLSKIRQPGQGDKFWDTTAYHMTLVNETIHFLDDHLASARADDPFFAYVALGAVHLPNSPPDLYFNESKVAGQYPTPHMDMISEVDLVVGSLMQALKNQDLIKDTLIVFTSDNGGLQNFKTKSQNYNHLSSGILRGYKSDIWEGGHRVPLIMRYDGGNFPAGQRRHHLVGLNDLFATICDICGIKVPPNQALDSVSFANGIYANKITKGLRKYLATWTYTLSGNKKQEDAIRYGKFKLVRIYGKKHYRVKKVMLFDLESDLSEKHDLSQVLQYKGMIAKMVEVLHQSSSLSHHSLPIIMVVLKLSGQRLGDPALQQVYKYLGQLYYAHLRQNLSRCPGRFLHLKIQNLDREETNEFMSVKFGGMVWYGERVKRDSAHTCIVHAFKKKQKFRVFLHKLHMGRDPWVKSIQALKVWKEGKLLQSWPSGGRQRANIAATMDAGNSSKVIFTSAPHSEYVSLP